MVSSDSGGVGGVGLADSSVGSIVWVRRRNGSWWPGKILGPDELSSTHLMSPRSGTPVKLLGREDASVDWYNLEKSKRVKAFRCGEFDECIEKAEASLGLPAKKREKYARREDAILHALELEKEFLEKKYGKSGATSSSMKNHLSDSVAKDLATSSGTPGNGNITHQNYEMQHMHGKGDLSGGNEGHCNPPPAPKIRSGNWQESHNTHPPSSTALNGSHEMLVDGHGHALGSSSDADSGNSSGRVKGLTDGCRGFNQVVRMSSNMLTHSLLNAGNYAQVKRSRALHMPSASNDLVDVKGGSSAQNDMFASHLREGSCHRHTNGFADDASSGSSENTESDSSETDSVEHAMDAEMNTFADSKTPLDAQPRPLNRLEMQDHASISSEDQDPLSPGDAPHFHYHDPISLGMGISRWQLKGKRNVRSLPRKSLDMYSSRSSFLDAGGGKTLSQRTNESVSCYRNNDYNNDVEFCERDVGPSMEGGLGNRGCVSNPQSAIRRQGFLGQNMIEMEELMVGNRYFSGYWGERNGGFSSFYVGRHGRDMLLDVDLKVEAHYRGGEHVPWVSLMSRLNGKAIIGHPIQIEKLEDGCTDSLLSTLDDFENFECDNDGNRTVPPMWRTARRTANVRVPRPHVSQPEDVDSLYLLDDLDRGPQFGRSAPGISAQKKELGKRKCPHVHKLSKKKKKKKTPKKSNLSSGQKIRPLSSIGNDHNLGSDPRGGSYNDYMDGVIKPLDSGPPTVACIPLKLVFSRLLEAVGRPPSGSTNHGVAANSNKDLDPNLHRLQQEPRMPVDGPIHKEDGSD